MTTHYSPMSFNLLSLVFLAGIAALYGWTSRINRFFFFARTLPPDVTATPPALAISRRYVNTVCFAFLGSAALFLGCRFLAGCGPVRSLAIAAIAFTIGQNAAFAQAHRAAGAAFSSHSDTPGTALEIPLSPATRVIGLPLQLAPTFTAALITALAFLASALTHRHLAAMLDTPAAANLTGLPCGILFASTAYFIATRYSSRRHAPMSAYISSIMLYCAWAAAALLAFIFVSALRGRPVTQSTQHIIGTVIVCLLAIHIVYAWTRSRSFTPPAAEWHRDACWRFGLFYYNPSDPALLVQRRSGPGYTFNYGKALAWPITAAIIADLLFLTIHYGNV